MRFQHPSTNWHRDAAIALLLTLLALFVRVDRLGFNSLSEDETAKWLAVQEYRQGHFVGVNSEHPMLPKVLEWTSLTVGEHWARLSSAHGWPAPNPEAWLRLPNVVLGSLTVAALFLLCRQLMGFAGAFAASFFWAISPLAIALNRLAKEETPLTFFTVLACYFYCRAKRANANLKTRRWYDLSAMSFALAFASQYMIHLFGLNQLAWYLAGRNGLDHKPFAKTCKRFLVVMFVTFLVVNPVFFSPANFNSVLHWLHHDGIRHSGYAFEGRLYVNLPGRLLAGLPWYYYVRLLFVKTPIPILASILAGSVLLLLRNRRSLASCFFLSFGVLQIVPLSLCGAKWIRYSLPMLPFLYLAGGYAVQEAWNWMQQRRVSMALAGATAVALVAWPVAELYMWSPYYPFYLNSLGGGARNITHYFTPDEVSEFDTREVAQQVCPTAPQGARLATARPMSMHYYIEQCGRNDIQVLPLYDSQYVPSAGDLIILEPSRRFFETQRFFDALATARMSHSEVHVGPVLASTIYHFEPSTLDQDGQEVLAGGARPKTYLAAHAAAPKRMTTDILVLWPFPLRRTR